MTNEPLTMETQARIQLAGVRETAKRADRATARFLVAELRRIAAELARDHGFKGKIVEVNE
jgi:hypothetical protein